MKRLLLALVLALWPLVGEAQTTTPCLQMTLPPPLNPSTNNTWGATVNTNFRILDAVQSGLLTMDLTAQGATLVLSATPGDPTAQAIRGHFQFTGTPSGAITVLWPRGACRVFSAFNNTSQTLVLGANNGSGAAAGATVSVSPGYVAFATSDGTNVYAPPNVVSIATLPGLPQNQFWVGNGSGVATQTSPAAVSALLAVEQSWSPTLRIGGGVTGIAYGTQQGKYVTLGNVTLASFNIVLTNKGLLTGALSIAGLPIASDTVGGDCSFGYYTNVASVGGNPMGWIGPGTSIATLYERSSTGSVAMTDANLTNTTQLSGTCQYLN